MPLVRQIIMDRRHYYACNWRGAFQLSPIGDTLVDATGKNGMTRLGPQYFCWLCDIRAGYHVSKDWETCRIETSCRIDLLISLVMTVIGGESKSKLNIQLSLLAGARACYYSIAGAPGHLLSLLLICESPCLLLVIETGTRL